MNVIWADAEVTDVGRQKTVKADLFDAPPVGGQRVTSIHVHLKHRGSWRGKWYPGSVVLKDGASIRAVYRHWWDRPPAWVMPIVRQIIRAAGVQ